MSTSVTSTPISPVVTTPVSPGQATTTTQQTVGSQTVNGRQATWVKRSQQAQQTPFTALRDDIGHNAASVIFKAIGLKQFGKVTPQEQQKAQALAQAFKQARTAQANRLATTQGGDRLSESALALKVAIVARLGGKSTENVVAKAMLESLGLDKGREASKKEISQLLDCADRYKNSLGGQMAQVFAKQEYAKMFAGMHKAINMAPAEYDATIAKLSDDELCALHCYTDQVHCDQINIPLRNGQPLSANYATAMQLANQAMDKMPDFQGVCYRGSKLPRSVDATLTTGGTFRDPAFISSAADHESAFQGAHQMTIWSKTGKDISFVSFSPHEKEVLFRAGTTFDVLARKGDVTYPPGTNPKDSPVNPGKDKTNGWGECRASLVEADPVQPKKGIFKLF